MHAARAATAITLSLCRCTTNHSGALTELSICRSSIEAPGTGPCWFFFYPGLMSLKSGTADRLGCIENRSRLTVHIILDHEVERATLVLTIQPSTSKLSKYT